MVDVDIPTKSLACGVIGLLFAGFFVIMNWLDSWIFFGVFIVGLGLVVNRNFNLFPVGITGMLGAGVFTKMSWLDPVLFFSALVVAALILAQQIVSKQTDGAG